jgi:hypothetical protein
MRKRQIVFGIICFLVGVMVGMEIAANIDLLVRIVMIVVILLLLVYLALPSLSRWTRMSRGPAQRTPRRPTGRKRNA